MDKYCTNCGKEINLEADYCIGCGKKINKPIKKQNNTLKINEILSIIGMIFGIISFFLVILLSFGLEETRISLIREDYFIRFLCGCVYTAIPLVPAVISLIMSIIGIKKQKSIYGMLGLIFSLITVIFSILSILYILS